MNQTTFEGSRREIIDRYFWFHDNEVGNNFVGSLTDYVSTTK